jgi:hypothetical protein
MPMRCATSDSLQLAGRRLCLCETKEVNTFSRGGADPRRRRSRVDLDRVRPGSRHALVGQSRGVANDALLHAWRVQREHCAAMRQALRQDRWSGSV